MTFLFFGVAVPSIQSTSSIILNSPTPAVVPTQSPISEGKFFSFGALSDEQIRTIYLPFLGTRTSAIQQISETYIAILISPLGVPGKNISSTFRPSAVRFFDFSVVFSDIFT